MKFRNTFVRSYLIDRDYEYQHVWETIDGAVLALLMVSIATAVICGCGIALAGL